MAVDTGMFDEVGFYSQFEEKLQEYSAPGARRDNAIAGWCYTVTDEEVTTMGLKDNHIGGPYRSPQTTRKLKGHLYIIWRDGRRTQVSIDRAAATEFDKQLEVWRGVSYEDPDGAPILAPGVYPEVKLVDERVWGLVSEGADLFFDMLSGWRQRLQDDYGVETVNASIRCSRGRRTIRNSKGLNVTYYQTGFSFHTTADHVYGLGYAKRRYPTDDEIEHVVATTGQTAEHLRQPAQMESKKMTILVPPEESDQFLSAYIHSNLDGEAILNGQSYFREEDFRRQKQVLRADVDCVLDPLRELEYGSAPCTHEGVPARRTKVVESGRLLTPLLDLKYAAKAGLEPTPPGALLLRTRTQPAFQEVLEGTEEGILVCSVMGLHSQDRTSGDYSVTIDQGILVRQGRLAGRVKATISGNFFDQLKDPDTVYAYSPYADQPGLRFTASATIESVS